MPDDDPELTPAQETRMRRLLADARHTEPMPAGVTERLDRVLAELQAQGDAGVDPVEPDAPAPIDLAARRRRRVGRILVAAAAVVVVGLGVGRLVDDDRTAGRDQADDASVDRPEGAYDRNGAADSPEADSAPAAPESPPAAAQSPLDDLNSLSLREYRDTGVARISSRDFAADVARYQDAPGLRVAAGRSVSRSRITDNADFVCRAADYGSGELLAARYDGTPTVLAYRAAPGDSQVVDLLQCGSGDILRSVTIPLP